MAETRAQKNRGLRQEALREQLSNQKHVEQVVKNINKIDKLACLKIDDFNDAEEYLAEVQASKDKVQILKVAIESRLKLVNKYLPDLKSTEISGPDGGDIGVSQSVTFTFNPVGPDA
jgi:hypothetical protein